MRASPLLLLAALALPLAIAAAGSAQCTLCGPTQICCGERERFCCEAATEECGLWGACLPKHPFTPSPQSTGGLAWAANLSTGPAVFGPVPVNATHVVASAGSGVNWVRLADGTTTFALAPPAQYPLFVAGGHVVVASEYVTMTLDVATGQPGWSLPNTAGSPFAAWGDYILVSQYQYVTVLDARAGVALYNVSLAPQDNLGPAVTKYGTVAFSNQRFFMFDLRTGTVLVNASCPCGLYGAAPMVDDASGVVVSCNLVAYDAKTGAVRWSVAGGSIIASSLAVTSDGYAASGQVWGGQPWMAGLSKSKGGVLWNVSAYTNIPPVLIGAGELVLIAHDTLVAYRAATGEMEWNCSSLELAPGFVNYGFAFDDRHRIAYTLGQKSSNPLALVAVNMTGGTIADYFEVGMWPQEFNAYSPVLAAGHALFLSQNGFLYSLRTL